MESNYYSVFGLSLHTTENFNPILAPGKPPADLEYRIHHRPPAVGKSTTQLGQSVYNTPEGLPIFVLWQQLETYRVEFANIATYDLTPKSIVCYPNQNAVQEELTNTLLADVFSLLLELNGITVLHASSIVAGKDVIAFLSHSGNGKSTLAATFMQAGFPLLSDDVLPIEHVSNTFMCRPSYPCLRLWPDEAQYFSGQLENFSLVHPKLAKRWITVGANGFGKFCANIQSLGCIYLPERDKTNESRNEILISPISPRDAVIELVRFSFEPHFVEVLGLQPRRLELFTQLAQRVPIRRIKYSSGFQYLPHVRDAILEDRARLR